jgi:hypothetical protein
MRSDTYNKDLIDFICNFDFPKYHLNRNINIRETWRDSLKDKGIEEFYLEYNKVKNPTSNDWARADTKVENMTFWLVEISKALQKEDTTLGEFKEFLTNQIQ